MALKIKSIDGITNIVVESATSANNVPASGIIGLEDSDSVKIINEDGKVSFSAATSEPTDLSEYYKKTETSGKKELSSAFSSVYNNIAKEYDPNKDYYRVGSLVMHDNQLYQAQYNTQSGAFNPIYWSATNVDNVRATRLTIYPDAGNKQYPSDEEVINAIKSRSLVLLSEEVPGSPSDGGRPQDFFILSDGYISTGGCLIAKFIRDIFNDNDRTYAYNTTGGLDYGSKIYMFSADLKTNNPGVWTTGINKIFSTDSNYEYITSLYGYPISAAGQTGDYVEHSELTCKIGTDNTGTSTAVLIQGKNNLTLGQCALVQGENNIAGYYSFAQGTDNIAGRGTGDPNYAALAQGWANTAENYSLAQGNHCSAVATAFAQGDNCSAYNYSFAQGNKCYAYDGASFAQGQYASATNWGVAFGNKTSATNNSFVLGSQSRSINWSIAAGQTVSAYQASFAQGQSVTAKNYSLAQGSNLTADQYSFVQGQNCSAASYSIAQGGWYCYAYNQSIAQGTNCSAKDQSFAQGEACTAINHSLAQGNDCKAEEYSQAFGRGTVITNYGMAIGKYNKTSANAAFVIGNGANNANRSDLFLISANGVASAADFIAGGVSLSSLAGMNFIGEDGIQVTESADGYHIGVSASSELSAGAGIAITTAANVTTISLSGCLTELMYLLNNKPATGHSYTLGLDTNGNLSWLEV